jgi:hypothetical protein
MSTNARYIAIADLALKRSYVWSNEYDKQRDGFEFHPYFIKRLNDEWSYDKTEVVAADYDYVMNNAYELYQGDAWSCFRSFGLHSFLRQ